MEKVREKDAAKKGASSLNSFHPLCISLRENLDLRGREAQMEESGGR